MMRRITDITVALCGLLLLAPVFLLIAALIRIDSPGRPLYGGWRIGKDGRRFRMWKFRTMVRDADRIGPGITASQDPRVTRIGRYLRDTKLDELPQLFNLLMGDLTLVGPRAELPEFVAQYTAEQRKVLSVKPGITGLGQIFYTTDQAGLIHADVPADTYYVEHLLGPKLQIDLDYAHRQTALSDLRVIAKTFAILWKAFVGRRTEERPLSPARGSSLPLR